MPTDIAPRLGPIQVCDWEGAGLPFSKGLLATQILATGLETDRAYAIAADVERELVEKRVRAISAGELEERVSSMLTTRISAESATRFLAWRSVKRSGRPFLVALCGVPGVGKSTLATRLAVRLGINHLITTDTIREVLRTVIPETVLAELHVCRRTRRHRTRRSESHVSRAIIGKLARSPRQLPLWQTALPQNVVTPSLKASISFLAS